MLFADCRDFTRLTHELGVEKITPAIDEFYRACFDIIVGQDGIVDKFLGDAVMAYFNAPIKHEDHMARAVGAATQIQLAMPRLNAKLGGEVVLRVGIGLSTGRARVYVVGTSHDKDYTVIGDPVNIASRLQGQAASGEVLVTEEVYEAVKTAFPNAQRREYQLKGIQEPVVAYVLT